MLAADDEANTLEALTQILSSDGFEVTSTQDVDNALGRLRTGAFDLVLTDLYFDDAPRGYDIAAAARDVHPAVPVVMLTGRPSFGNACEALRSQVAEILVKPIDTMALLETCRRAVAAAAIDRRARSLEARNRVLARVVPRMVEAKDPTTSGHSERVVGYTDTLAIRCGISDSDREALRLASLLHDVGKIGIPKSILCKAGPLTADERAVINTHPQIGYEILADLEDSENVRQWVYQHHERWDGRGYPCGLRGDEVALAGRILVLAEVYDALVEERSYKPAWPIPKIVGFFREEAGKHFDPDLAHMVADGLESRGKGFFVDGATLPLFAATAH